MAHFHININMTENDREEVPGLQVDKIKRLIANVQNALLRNMSSIDLKIKKADRNSSY